MLPGVWKVERPSFLLGLQVRSCILDKDVHAEHRIESVQVRDVWEAGVYLVTKLTYKRPLRRKF